MKKYLSILLTLALFVGMLAISGCAKSDSEDLDYIKEKGTLVVGVIDAPPLTVLDDQGEWTGLSADLARGFGKTLGVDVVFKEIEWAEMEHVLNDKTVDCIGSAMTLLSDRRAVMACTNGYLNNSQIVVTRKERAKWYSDAEDCLKLKFAVLDGSVHETAAKENGFVILATDTTDEALELVTDGTADAAIINSIFATETIGEGKQFPDLARAFPLVDNKIGFAFRKGSALAGLMNKYFVTTYTSGQMKKMADRYDIGKLIVEQVTEQ